MNIERLSFLLIILTGLLSACGSKDPEDNQDKKFSLSESMKKSITLDISKLSCVESELKLSGKVTYDEEKVVKVYPIISGNVTEVKVSLGDRVKKGQVLAVVKSVEMAGLENDLSNSKSNVEIAQANFKVAEEMYKSGITSEKEYITSKKELEKAQSEFRKTNNINSVYGGKPSAEMNIISPISGVIVEKTITPGMQIRTDYSNNLFTISDLKNVWVIANVFETDISKIQQGYDADIVTLSYPDKIIKGKVDKIYSVLDPVTRVMKAQIKLDNADFLLKPEMFANVIVHYSENCNKICIPSKAVIFDNSKSYVMVYKSNHEIETRVIEIYKSVKDKTYINVGLKEGEKVISTNQLLIYNELNG